MEARFEELRRMIEEWPDTPPMHLSNENKLMYRAAKEAVRCPNILEAQRYIFCNHPASFMVRPVVEMLYDALAHDVGRR